MKDFRTLLAIPLLLLIIIIIQEKNTDALVYELVCTDPFVDETINNLKKKIAYRTIEVLQNPGSINAAKTNKKIKHIKEQINCLAETPHVKRFSFLFEGMAMKKDKSVAAYQRESECFNEINKAMEGSMKTTLSHIYFDEGFTIDRESLVGTDYHGTEYQCELNDVSAEYAL